MRAISKLSRAIAGSVVRALCRLLLKEEDRYLIPSLEPGAGPEQDRFSYQSRFIDFAIKKDERVLDVGFGAYPFPHATDLADLYEGQTTHRAEPLRRDGRPFKKCDIEALPYKDKEFDFVYCSHVLEHVRDPAKACQEIMRIGKRGYIETPTRTSDIMLNFTKLKDHHQWHVVLAGNALVFFKWLEKERRDMGSDDFFRMLHSSHKNPFQDLMRGNRDMFANMLMWEEGFSYYVFDQAGELTASHVWGRGAARGI